MTDYVGDVAMSDQQTAIAASDLLGKRVWANGKGYIYLYCGATATKNTPYRIAYTTGVAATMPASGAFTDGAYVNEVVIPVFRTMASGDTGWFQFFGLVTTAVLPSADYTATYALRVYDGAIAQISAVPTGGNTEFGCVISRLTTGAVTAANIYLFGRQSLGVT